ncbi:MAG: tryptophan synthase alpha chain [Moritella dasanensis]|jgi:tryptophan synthase alpha chain
MGNVMGRYQQAFAALAEKNEGAFVPFVTIGDPNREQSMAIIDTLVAAGADALELGIPFSDPVADGPTIQKATSRALNAGINPNICFEMLTEIRAKYPQMPIGLLLYANLVYGNGTANFMAKAAAAGVDSLLIADVPVQYGQQFKEAGDKVGIESIYIAPPNANDETLKQVAEQGSGYTYLLSRAGVTGAETKAEMPVGPLLAKLKSFNAAPCLLGFGISSPEQVKKAIEAGAAGAISGSAIVNIIEKNLGDNAQMLQELAEFVTPMKAATRA